MDTSLHASILMSFRDEGFMHDSKDAELAPKSTYAHAALLSMYCSVITTCVGSSYKKARISEYNLLEQPLDH